MERVVGKHPGNFMDLDGDVGRLMHRVEKEYPPGQDVRGIVKQRETAADTTGDTWLPKHGLPATSSLPQGYTPIQEIQKPMVEAEKDLAGVGRRQ